MLALDFEASPDKVNDVEQFVVLRLAYLYEPIGLAQICANFGIYRQSPIFHR